MSTAINARIPLVRSHRPPGAPLGERIAYLTAPARQPDGAGLTALDLAARQPEAGTAQLRDAITKVAASDAYAARDVLGHSAMRAQLNSHQERQLTSVVAAAGLGAGYLPPCHMDAITAAVDQAEEHLRVLLRPGGPAAGPQEDPERRTAARAGREWGLPVDNPAPDGYED